MSALNVCNGTMPFLNVSLRAMSAPFNLPEHITLIPAHRRLQQEGYNLEVINHLTRTHIVRTLIWSGLAIYSLKNALG